MLRERQDAPIWNAIEGNNFKQALKLVDKRLSKKPSGYLEALKLYIQSRLPALSDKSAVILHLEELVEKKLVISELETIELYDEAFGEVLPEPHESWDRIIGELRWLSVKSQPKNEDLSLKCFEACLAKDDLEHAKQISNSLEKSFPGNHAYTFWNISTMFLYSISLKYPEKQRKLWGSLAFAQIGKLATATRQANPKTLPIRSIHTPQELLLLHRITEASGKPEQRLEYLRDPALGAESTIAKGEWQLWRFRLKLLEDAKEWQELFDTAKGLLNRARTRDKVGQLSETGFSDWIVWEAFIRSAVELQEHEFRDTVVSEVEAHLDSSCEIDKSWKRNASLAWIKISFEAEVGFAQKKDSNDHKITIVVKYLQQYGLASTAFSDLRPFVEQLNAEERKKLLGILSSNSIFGDPGHSNYILAKPAQLPPPEYAEFKTAHKITQHINSYKLRYLLLSSIPENAQRQNPGPGQEYTCVSCSKPCLQYCKACLQALAEETAKLYFCAVDGGRHAWNLQLTDRHPADDLCVMAAMCLIKLSMAKSHEVPEIPYLIQAAIMLDYGTTHSNSNFQIRLLLTRLLQYLGLGAMAMSEYMELSLKQIQLDTLSFILFDRISSFHPHPFTPLEEDSQPYKSPRETIKKQQKLYRTSRGHIGKNIWLSFKNGSYNSIFELKEVSDTLSRTIAAATSVVETRKIARLLELNSKEPLDEGYDIIPKNPETLEGPFTDMNDYDTFPNFECTKGPRFEEIFRVFPSPSDYQVRVNLTTEKLIQLISPHPSIESTKSSTKAALLSFLSSATITPKPAINYQNLLTRPEDLARIASESMTLLILDACNKERWPEIKFQSRLDTYNNDLISSLECLIENLEGNKILVPPLASTFHALYTSYDIAKTTLSFSTFLAKQGKEAHESQVEASKKVWEVARKLMTVVAEKVTIVKKGMDEGGWIDKVLEDVLGPDNEESVIGKVRDLMDDAVLEVWAGNVVEAWRESVVGLGFLKVVAA